MNDDWRLQIDFDDEGLADKLVDHLRSAELEHELSLDLDRRVIISHDGATIFLYAGDRDQLDRARTAVQNYLDAQNWEATLELRHWHPVAEDWEDPDVAEPSTAAEERAERARLMKTEDEETAARGGVAEWEVRIEFPSHHEAREFAEKLKAEGVESVRRWRYMVLGAPDEDAAKELADRIRAETPTDAKVEVEGSLAAAWGERPVNPFFWLGGLAG